ncbi:MAG: LLM class F420-dependent oxidoreductase [Chloroflexi bacterium]|nr:LLM class F420-dependent oxidoreductase [Chloroflexota bacterium]
MLFGLVTPIATHLTRRHQPWEVESGPRELRQIAVTADRLGIHHISCSEHVGIPTHIVQSRGPRYYDPLATFGYLAAVTKRLKFLTHVIVLPYHHPLSVAKRYGTLDVISGGRLILGVGVGTLKEEFDLLGVEFEHRAERYTEGLQALRAAMGERQPVFHGKYYNFDDFIIDPHAVQERMPIWLGGNTKVSLRRAVASADGWDTPGLSIEQFTEIITAVKQTPEWKARASPLEVVIMGDPNYDISEPKGFAALVDQIAAYQKAGATGMNFYFRAKSLEHYCEQLETFASKIMANFR